MTSRERNRKVEGIILRHQRWGEADRLLTVFTREMGKVRVVAKGARKTQSRKAGHLEPFMQTALMLAQGHDWWIVTQAETVNAFFPLRGDLQKTGYAAYIIELMDKFTFEDGANTVLYRLAVETLQRLEAEDPFFVVIHYFEMRLLDALGFRPQLFQCVICESEIEAVDQYFSVLQGGVVCPRCSHKSEDARKVSMGALKYLRHFQRSGYKSTLAAKPDAKIEQEVEGIMQWYLTFLLERNINAQAFIREVRKGNSTSDNGEI